MYNEEEDLPVVLARPYRRRPVDPDNTGCFGCFFIALAFLCIIVMSLVLLGIASVVWHHVLAPGLDVVAWAWSFGD